MRLVLVGGTTETAAEPGISAAGADPELMRHTPGADLDVVVHGEPTLAPVVPVSPTGCPTPAVVTRAARELLGFDVIGVDAGIAGRTGAPTIDVGEGPGVDVREPTAVPDAERTYERARELGAALPDDRLVIGETIPGGTTTALGVLAALGEEPAVSSSLPENPLELKRRVVAEGLDTSGLAPGDAADDPLRAVSAVGDPVLAAVAGLTTGAVESGTEVTLAGGTQLAAAAALVRHAGVDAPLTLATTSFVADDGSAGIAGLADSLGVDLTVTDPEFDGVEHPAMEAYVAGEAKEGVGMGGALHLVDESAASMADLRERIVDVYDRLLAGADASEEVVEGPPEDSAAAPEGEP
ncbi:nicotinate mononucleotide-dependent phosphoribosyltransferase CobT [Halobaculum rarum]|uniref:nicotinate mononucleotide-dependent phosphoribosyltransferase CobT n=1 Tax=Halobaculum rarum TaxID=3075122 RepID=UPI0032AF4B92